MSLAEPSPVFVALDGAKQCKFKYQFSQRCKSFSIGGKTTEYACAYNKASHSTKLSLKNLNLI